jgi:hypothetical protein
MTGLALDGCNNSLTLQRDNNPHNDCQKWTISGPGALDPVPPYGALPSICLNSAGSSLNSSGMTSSTEISQKIHRNFRRNDSDCGRQFERNHESVQF